MSELIGSVVGGGIGGFLGGFLAGRITTVSEIQNGKVVTRVLIEPWKFLGVKKLQIKKSDGKVQLSLAGNIKAILLKADPNNTGRVYLGGSNVSIDDNHYPLDGNSTVSMQVSNFSDIYLLADSDIIQTVYIVMIGEKYE